MDICAEGLPAGELVAVVPIMVLEFLRETPLSALMVLLPACFPASLQTKPLKLSGQGNGGIVVKVWVLSEELGRRHGLRDRWLKLLKALKTNDDSLHASIPSLRSVHGKAGGEAF